MYESFFEMEHTPFTRDIPVDRLYTSPRIEDALGRLVYAADRQMFAVVMLRPIFLAPSSRWLIVADLPYIMTLV